MSYYDDDKLRPFKERAIGIQESTAYADQRPFELGVYSPSRGQADRVRHMLLAADLYSKNHPMAGATEMHEWEGDIAAAYERLTGDPDQATAIERETQQDRMSNAAGRKIGLLTSSRAEQEALVLNASKTASFLPESFTKRPVPPVYKEPVRPDQQLSPPAQQKALERQRAWGPNDVMKDLAKFGTPAYNAYQSTVNFFSSLRRP